jgi:hypothetical protein
MLLSLKRGFLLHSGNIINATGIAMNPEKVGFGFFIVLSVTL